MAYTVSVMMNGRVIASNKRFSSLKKADKYISSLLNTYDCHVQEEYDGANGHELVCSYSSRIFINPVDAE